MTWPLYQLAVVLGGKTVWGGNSSLCVIEWGAPTPKQPSLWQHLHPNVGCIPFRCCSPSPHASPQTHCTVSIYLSLPAFCLPSFPQLIYGCCLSASSHCSLNLAIMCGSLRRPSICGTSMQPDGLPSSSSIFPAMLVHPFGSGAAAHVLLVASVLPPRIPALSSQKPFVLGCSQASGGSAWSRRPSRAWGDFKEVIGVRCTEKSTLFCSK